MASRPPSDREPVRLALLGYGLGGSAFHAPLLRVTEGIDVAVVLTSDPGRAADARAALPGTTVVADVDEVWRGAGDLDAVVVTTPNRTHVPLARAALRAGLHVVVDKPLAPTAAEARALIREAEAAGRILTVYQNRRWDSDFLTLRRLLAEGRLGDVLRFESRFESWRPEPRPGWRQDPDPAAAGGLLYDLGSHLIDQALVLFGPVRSVYAEMDRSRPGATVDDDTFVALEHESGVRSHLWMNKVSARPGPRFRVLGSAGSWIKHGNDVQEAALRSGRDPAEPGFGEEPPETRGTLYDGDVATPTPAEVGAWPAFYAAFRDAVRGLAPPPVDPRDAVATLAVLEEARRVAGARG